MSTARDIVRLARGYLGTPFHHQGRIPISGLDCVGLVVRVASDMGIPVQDDTKYPRVARDNRMLEVMLHNGLTPIPAFLQQPGDVLVFWFNSAKRWPQHAAFRTDYGMLHTYTTVGRVVEHGYTPPWQKRLLAVLRFPEVEPWQQ